MRAEKLTPTEKPIAHDRSPGNIFLGDITADAGQVRAHSPEFPRQLLRLSSADAPCSDLVCVCGWGAAVSQSWCGERGSHHQAAFSKEAPMSKVRKLPCYSSLNHQGAPGSRKLSAGSWLCPESPGPAGFPQHLKAGVPRSLRFQGGWRLPV